MSSTGLQKWSSGVCNHLVVIGPLKNVGALPMNRDVDNDEAVVFRQHQVRFLQEARRVPVSGLHLCLPSMRHGNLPDALQKMFMSQNPLKVCCRLSLEDMRDGVGLEAAGTTTTLTGGIMQTSLGGQEPAGWSRLREDVAPSSLLGEH